MGTYRLDRSIGIELAKKSSEGLGCSFVMLGNGKFALLDYSDAENAKRWLWHLHGLYAARSPKPEEEYGANNMFMHRWIMGCQVGDGVLVDHANLNKMDNRRCNLRIASWHESIGNRPPSKNKTTSKFKGVFTYPRGFRVAVREGYANIHLGCFDSEIEAARAYNEWAKQHFGEFAYLNPV